MDFLDENHCRMEGGGEHNVNLQDHYGRVSEKHEREKKSTPSSVSSSQDDYGGAAGAAATSSKRSRPSLDGRCDDKGREKEG